MARREMTIAAVVLAAVAAIAIYRIMPGVEAQDAPRGQAPQTAVISGPKAPPAQPAPAVVAQTAAPVARQVPQSQQQVQMSFAPIVKAVAPTVVNVYATTVTQQSVSPFANDPFFGRLFGQSSPLFQTRPRESLSLGSGVIFDPSGVIVTNNHVINGATDVKVALQDGKEYPVDILVSDPKTDLAVLKIRDPGGQTFPALPFANSDGLEVGDLVLAVGNPFGVGQTVTSGIVSALGRTGVESSDYESFIQTDAAINPGNSGGALVNVEGQLVGINTAIFSKSGGSVGIGFAIPSNMARAVAEAAEHGGKIVRPWLGARMQDVTSDIANSLDMPASRGALITEVAKGSPAEQAGLQSGDVVTAIDGIEVDSPQSLNYHMATRQVGGSATLTYVRNGKTAKTTLKLAAAPTNSGAEVKISGNTRFAGVTASALTPAVAQDMGLPFNAKGVVITDVAQNSPADAMGLQVGDIVVNLNGTDITDVNQFKSMVSRRISTWQITIQRDGQMIRSYISG